ncbi:hypothetical protein [Deminuibacter soli]|uniref:Uncharacterized protein n=1 Tax=Deminuibacter soli TaxID=2291815 RepID=A0A3E1NLN6_9BACT|nr:hypothetical protein [Deminuibacter soli]RFM28708.1 hypothetical protein DXN05_07945 [Deminuibacter soli]
MQKKKPEVDIIEKILDACYAYNPDKLFVMSLMHQYEERGSLSKKQLQGLFQIAQKVPDLSSAWLATLESIILKMPTRYKSEKPVPAAPAADDTQAQTEQTIEAILVKYPAHKRVLFFKAKFSNNEALTPAELTELEKFAKLLLK